MKKLLMLLLAITMLITLTCSCALKSNQTPPGCEDSVLYNKTNPELAGVLIQLGSSVIEFKNPEHRQQTIVAINAIKNLLSSGSINFTEFVEQTNVISEKYYNKYNVGLIMINSLLSQIHISAPINNCDKQLIISWCDQMLAQL